MKKINFLVIFLAVLALLVLPSCIQEKKESPEQNSGQGNTSSTLPQLLEEISSEQFAKIDYSIYIEGKIADTSKEELARSIENQELLNASHPFGLEPLTFIIDSPWVNYRISDAVKEMRINEVRNVSIPSEFSVFGTYNKELVRTLPRLTFIPKTEKIDKLRYLFFYGKEPALNETLVYDYWNSTVTGIDNESVTIEHMPQNNTVREGEIGNITITFNKSTIVMRLTPVLNKTIIARTGEMVTITGYNETTLTADFNHPFAGKNLTFEIKLLEKGELTIWSRNIEDAVNANVGIAEFYDFTCMDCLRFEREAATSPDVLALKDKVKFAKINAEIEKELARKYNITAYPTILIFKKGEEAIRIPGFVKGVELRGAIEQLLIS